MNKKEKMDLAGAVGLLFFAVYGACSFIEDIINIITMVVN